MPEAVIVDAIRTPIGRAFKGSLTQVRPDDLTAYVVDQLLERNPEVDPGTVEDLVCGCGMPQGEQAYNIGRIIVLLSEKLPDQVTGSTIARYCASSLNAIRIAADAIKAGNGDLFVAAGVESVSRAGPHSEATLPDTQNPKLRGKDGTHNAYISMGETAENVVERYGGKREAARARARVGDERPRAGDHGRRADRRDPQRAQAHRHDDRGRRRRRAQRGVRRAGAADHERVRHPAREAEPARRRDRARPP